MLSERIVQLRKASMMSQAQLASVLRISASAVGMYEQARRTPDLNMLIAMAEIFDVSLDYLITGEEHKCQHSKTEQLPFPCSSCFWKEYRQK